MISLNNWGTRCQGTPRSLFLLMLLSLLVSPSWSLLAQQKSENRNVTIEVYEKGSNEAIPGVIISLNGKKVGVTNIDGRVVLTLSSSVKNNFIKLSHLGYKELDHYRIPQDKKTIKIYLEDGIELEEVVVTERKRSSSIFQQAVAIDTKTLEQGAGKTLGALLENVPGVSSIKTGNTIAKPVIQGMHSSRILLVDNGMRLESQSWGDDHAPEIDHTSKGMVEVVKGAEAIRYGYGAMGGVVLFTDEPLHFGHKKLHVSGRTNLGFASNGRGYNGSATLNLGYKAFGLRLHSMYQRVGDYSTAEYILNNTGARTASFSGSIGFETKPVTVTISSSLYNSRSGIYYASKISDIEQLMARFQAGRPDPVTFAPFSYNIRPPFQQSQHFTLKGDLIWRINPLHELSVKLSYQDNLREEFEDRKNDKISWLPVQDLVLTSYGTETVWTGFWNLLDMETQAGVSTLFQWNYNYPGTKQPAFIPNYTALTMGAFLVQKLKWKGLQASLGLRYDIRALGVNGYESLRSFKYFEDYKRYNNFTANVALHYQITEQVDVRTNVGFAWRPPDVNELYAQGLHHGTYWVVGNKNLEGERSLKAVLGARYRHSIFSVEGGFFYQNVQNYIYDSIGEGVNRFHNHPSGKFPKFIYDQDHVSLTGGDLTGVVQPFKGLEVSLKGEWLIARNLSKNSWLPYMPSDRYTLSSHYDWSWGKQNQWSASFGLDGHYVTQQRNFDPQKDLVPETPPAYFLLGANAEVALDLNKGRSIKLLFTGENALNALYKEYTDRFRYYAHASGANYSLRTIINF